MGAVQLSVELLPETGCAVTFVGAAGVRFAAVLFGIAAASLVQALATPE